MENKHYEDKILHKTAYLFAYALDSVMLLLHEDDSEFRKHVFDFGLNYGQYYQYIDDYIDYDEDSESGSMNLVSENNGNKDKCLSIIANKYNTCTGILGKIPNGNVIKDYIDDINDEFYEKTCYLP